MKRRNLKSRNKKNKLRKINKKEKILKKDKYKIWIDLDLEGKELQIVLDELYCNIPDTELLNAVIKGDKEFIQENYSISSPA